MARGRKSRNWIKVDCEGLLRGSINYLLPLDGQAIWIKMIAFSEVCGGRPGWIEDNNQKGLPLEFVAQELHCSMRQFNLVLEKMKEDKAIEMNGTGAIHLVNFDHYQFGEYERQSPYRQGQKEAKKVESKTPKKAYGEFQNVMLTDEELEKLSEKFGEAGAKERIEHLSQALESKGYKYKSHYATILTWERMDSKRGTGSYGTHRGDGKKTEKKKWKPGDPLR